MFNFYMNEKHAHDKHRKFILSENGNFLSKYAPQFSKFFNSFEWPNEVENKLAQDVFIY